MGIRASSGFQVEGVYERHFNVFYDVFMYNFYHSRNISFKRFLSEINILNVQRIIKSTQYMPL